MEWKHSLFNYFLLTGIVLAFTILLVGVTNGYYDPAFLISVFSFIVAFGVSLFLYNKTTLKAEEEYVLTMNDEFIVCRHSEKPAETVKWKEITQIIVVTTDKGPYEPYLWILLSNDTGQGCMFPLGAKNSKPVIEKILGFGQFNLERWSQALQCTTNHRFVVWEAAKAFAIRY